MPSRHSSFYSPLPATFVSDLLHEEGLHASYHVLPAGRTVGALLAGGEIEVAQSAVSYRWSMLEKGGQPPAWLFVQINQRDGFFIRALSTGRCTIPESHWGDNR
jgi:hypothetical protein